MGFLQCYGAKRQKQNQVNQDGDDLVQGDPGNSSTPLCVIRGALQSCLEMFWKTGSIFLRLLEAVESVLRARDITCRVSGHQNTSRHDHPGEFIPAEPPIRY